MHNSINNKIYYTEKEVKLRLERFRTIKFNDEVFFDVISALENVFSIEECISSVDVLFDQELFLRNL